MQALMSAMNDVGIIASTIPPIDGEWHNYPTVTKPNKVNGRVWVAKDEPHNWIVKDFQTHLELKGTIKGNNGQVPDTSFIKRKPKPVESLPQEAQASVEACAKDPYWILTYSDPCSGHWYLATKGVEACPGLFISGLTLAIPILDAQGCVQGIQKINHNGDKLFTSGSKKAGNYFPIPGTEGTPLLIGEGLATCLSAHEATGFETLVAFDCGNLASVAQVARELFPSRQIILLADNDTKTEGNPGLTKALEAAKGVGGQVATPPHGDFNDLHQEKGLNEVASIIMKCLDKPKEDPFVDFRPEAILARESRGHKKYCFGTMRLGKFGVVAGPGGLGKTTYFATYVAISKATGVDFTGGIFPPHGEGKVVMYLAEEDMDDIKDKLDVFYKHHDLDEDIRKKINDNMVVKGLCGSGLELSLATRDDKGMLIPSTNYHDLMAELKNIESVSLIIIDPFSHFHNEDENNNSSIRKVASLLTAMANTIGASVLAIHHVNKGAANGFNGSQKPYTARLDVDSVRGAKTLTDSARWVCVLTNMQKNEVKGVHGDESDYLNYVAGRVDKNNFGPRESFILHRPSEGVYIRHDDSVDGFIRTRMKDMLRLLSLVEEGKHTAAMVKRSNHKAHAQINDAIMQGYVTEDKTTKATYLHISDKGRQLLSTSAK